MVRLEDYRGFAIFRDADGLYSARKIIGENTPTIPWNFSEVGAAAMTLEELKYKIDTNDISIPTS